MFKTGNYVKFHFQQKKQQQTNKLLLSLRIKRIHERSNQPDTSLGVLLRYIAVFDTACKDPVVMKPDVLVT